MVMEGASSYISEMVSTSVSVAKGSQVTFEGCFVPINPQHVFSLNLCVFVTLICVLILNSTNFFQIPMVTIQQEQETQNL